VNALERIRRTAALERCDRPPVIAQLFAHAAVACGRSMEEYLGSGATAAACQLEARRHYGNEAVFAVLDLALEAEALGGEIQRRAGTYPAVKRPPLAPDDDFARRPIPDPRAAGRLPMVLEMARAMRAACGDEALVVGLVQGPLTLAVQLLGMEPALVLAADDPDRFVRLLDYATAVSEAFGVAQLASGAHLALVFEPAASPEVVPAGLFREMIGPRVARLFASFRRAGALASWIHIAGRTAPLLPWYRRLGADLACFDYCVDPEPLARADGESRICVVGNLRPLDFVTGDAAGIARDAAALLRLFEGRGGFILSSGCEIPPEAREPNVAALVRTGLAWNGAAR